jgi:thioesterase domain-containing protein
VKPGERSHNNALQSPEGDLRQRLASLSPDNIRLLTGKILKSGGDVSLRSYLSDSYLSSLEEIRASGTKMPLFLVHPAGGGVKAYHELAKHLDAEQPVSAFQSHIFGSHETNPYLSIEQMATCYVDALQKARPVFPYVLSGWSMGGVVAFEMALQLTARNQPAPLVVMLDSYARTVVNFDSEYRRSRYLEDLILIGTAIALADGKDFRLSRNDLQGLSMEDQFSHFSQTLRKQEILTDDIDDRALRAVLTVFDNSDRAMANYVPRTYSGKVAVLRARESLPGMTKAAHELSNDPTLGWQFYCSQIVDVHSVPGNHMRIMTPPYIRALGRSLQSCIDEASKD